VLIYRLGVPPLRKILGLHIVGVGVAGLLSCTFRICIGSLGVGVGHRGEANDATTATTFRAREGLLSGRYRNAEARPRPVQRRMGDAVQQRNLPRRGKTRLIGAGGEPHTEGVVGRI
jgi:hypothetical protein